MQKRAKLGIVLFSILSIFLLTACSSLDLSSFFSVQKSVGKGVKVEILQAPSGELSQNEPFIFHFKVTNYNQEPVEGNLCLSALYVVPGDNLPSNDCKAVSLKAADISSSNTVLEDYQDYYFPSENGQYMYTKVRTDAPQQASFQASFKYAVSQKASTPICVKRPQSKQSCSDSETLSLTQTELPLKVTKVEKEITPLGKDTVQLKLNIYVDQNQDGQIIAKQSVQTSEVDFTPVVGIKPEFTGNSITFTCPSLVNGQFEMKASESIIKCFATVTMKQDLIQENLIVNLEYGFDQVIQLPSVKLTPLGVAQA